MSTLAIIPARYASTRFPGKPLVDIFGKTMIQRVYEQVKKSHYVEDVVVATDDERIFHHLMGLDCKVMMTGVHHRNGTERCLEVAGLHSDFDFILNVQGDEPFIDPSQIDILVQSLDMEAEIVTLVKKIETQAELESPNVVKVVFNKQDEAMYFSRSIIPFCRNEEQSKWVGKISFYKHIGIYAYRMDILRKITQCGVSFLEKAESLEQLRWIENGFRIRTIETDRETIGIDTPEDLERARNIYHKTM
ncbi:MAG: 3-deoxy-manno-octulosonate cytidylyltransferase [Chitinophagaceae bacterium]|nr:3-deoxy-manno-octulosonate cytidylyltransferase [Chitinophagaceae bacterium]